MKQVLPPLAFRAHVTFVAGLPVALRTVFFLAFAGLACVWPVGFSVVGACKRLLAKVFVTVVAFVSNEEGRALCFLDAGPVVKVITSRAAVAFHVRVFVVWARSRIRTFLHRPVRVASVAVLLHIAAFFFPVTASAFRACLVKPRAFASQTVFAFPINYKCLRRAFGTHLATSCHS